MTAVPAALAPPPPAHAADPPDPTGERAVRPARCLGVRLDPLTLAQAVARVRRWCDDWHAAGRPAGAGQVVVTPNVDHLVKLHRTRDEGVKAAYAAADLSLADGTPVVAAARRFGVPVPERVPGSDLVPAILADATAARPLSVFLLGAGPGVADAAAARITRDHPHVAVAGTHCPPLGFKHDAGENGQILDLLAEAKPDVLVVGLGFPKQELWVHAHRDRIAAGAVLCVGATIDFLAGRVARAPGWMGPLGVEWLFRLSREPRRLAGRYVTDLLWFPRVLWREWRGGGRGGNRAGR